MKKNILLIFLFTFISAPIYSFDTNGSTQSITGSTSHMIDHTGTFEPEVFFLDKTVAGEATSIKLPRQSTEQERLEKISTAIQHITRGNLVREITISIQLADGSETKPRYKYGPGIAIADVAEWVEGFLRLFPESEDTQQNN